MVQRGAWDPAHRWTASVTQRDCAMAGLQHARAHDVIGTRGDSVGAAVLAWIVCRHAFDGVVVKARDLRPPARKVDGEMAP